jgi:hypothetical protein
MLLASTRDLARRTDYLHVLPGRMRLRIPEVRHAPERAAEVEEALIRIRGVRSVRANPRTGMALIHFDDRELTAVDVGRFLIGLDVLGEGSHPRQVPDRHWTCSQCGASDPEHDSERAGPAFAPRRIMRKLVGVVASNIVELALKRAILALI